MRTRIPSLSVLSTMTLLAMTACVPARADWGAGWAVDDVWDDGRAEIAYYDAVRVIYGEPRTYEAVAITVKEPFDRDALVKVDGTPGEAALAVLKLNVVRDIPTESYPYRMMTSVYVERARPERLLKATNGSHEWCGNTWQALRVADGRARYEWQSYFEGEADGSQEIGPLEGTLLSDQLLLVLRGLAPRDGLERRLSLLPSIADTRGGPLRASDARLRVVGRESLTVPAGTFDAWRLRIDGGPQPATWWIRAGGSGIVLKVEADDGERLELRRAERRAYWNPDAPSRPWPG